VHVGLVHRAHAPGVLGCGPGKDNDVWQGMVDEKGVLFVDDSIVWAGKHILGANNCVQAGDKHVARLHVVIIVSPPQPQNGATGQIDNTVWPNSTSSASCLTPTSLSCIRPLSSERQSEFDAHVKLSVS